MTSKVRPRDANAILFAQYVSTQESAIAATHRIALHSRAESLNPDCASALLRKRPNVSLRGYARHSLWSSSIETSGYQGEDKQIVGFVTERDAVNRYVTQNGMKTHASWGHRALAVRGGSALRGSLATFHGN